MFKTEEKCKGVCPLKCNLNKDRHEVGNRYECTND